MANFNMNTSIPTTKLQIHPREITQTTSVVTESVYDYDMPDLPFYYYNMHLSIIFIVIGVVILVSQVFFYGFLIFIFNRKKKYKCPKCRMEYSKTILSKKICKMCGSRLVEVERD